MDSFTVVLHRAGRQVVLGRVREPTDGVSRRYERHGPRTSHSSRLRSDPVEKLSTDETRVTACYIVASCTSYLLRIRKIYYLHPHRKQTYHYNYIYESTHPPVHDFIKCQRNVLIAQ